MPNCEKTKLSIVIPMYYNEKNLPITYNKLKETVLNNLCDYELILVDDGSKDNSYQEALKLQEIDKKVIVLKLSRNFGQHAAILAGLSRMTGAAAVVISADLQDPPELILQLLAKYNQGNKVVLAIREGRNESCLQKFFSKTYYQLMRSLAIKDMPIGGFDCFLADAKVVKVLIEIDEKNSSLFAQVLWLGFTRAEVHYTRNARQIGNSRWTISKKVKLTVDSLLSFSYVPIRTISIIGLIDCFLSLSYASYIIIQKIFWGANAGWASVMVAIMFTSGVQMLTLGVIGEYLWRNFDASRKRPTYIIETE